MLEQAALGGEAEAGDSERAVPGPPRPGALRSKIALSLHTIQASLLVSGRQRTEDKNGIPGLNLFAWRLESLAADGAGGDESADRYLARIDEALGQAGDAIERSLDVADERLASVPGLEIGMAESVAPTIHELRFRSRHGFRAAQLIARLDHVIIKLLTLRHVGLMEQSDVDNEIGSLLRQVRRVFDMGCAYRSAIASIAAVPEHEEEDVDAAEPALMSEVVAEPLPCWQAAVS